MSFILGQFPLASAITEGGRANANTGARVVNVGRYRRDEAIDHRAGGDRPWTMTSQPSGARHQGPTIGYITSRHYLCEVADLFGDAPRRMVDPAVVMSPAHRRPRSPLRLARTTTMNAFRMKREDPDASNAPTTRLNGTQSVTRAIDIIDAIAERPMMLSELATHVGLSTTTCYRLANALVARGLLSSSGRSGYSLGDRISELGASLAQQRSRLAED